MRENTAVTPLAAVAAGLVSVFAFADALAATPSVDIECRMSIPARVASRTSIPLTFELINRNKKVAYNVLNWDTPLEGFYGPFLQVTGPGGEVRYRGVIVERAATPTREEYVNIKSGGRLTKTVNLAPAYEFKVSGRYEVAFTGKLVDATREKIPRALELRTKMEIACPVVAFELAAGR